MRKIFSIYGKLEVIGDSTLNRRERVELRCYGYVVRILGKSIEKTGKKEKKKQQKELTKIKAKGT